MLFSWRQPHHVHQLRATLRGRRKKGRLFHSSLAIRKRPTSWCIGNDLTSANWSRGRLNETSWKTSIDFFSFIILIDSILFRVCAFCVLCFIFWSTCVSSLWWQDESTTATIVSNATKSDSAESDSTDFRTEGQTDGTARHPSSHWSYDRLDDHFYHPLRFPKLLKLSSLSMGSLSPLSNRRKIYGFLCW